MKTIASRLALTAAAAGLAIAPIAAQANTRAGDFSTAFSAPASQPGVGRSTSGEGLEGEGGAIILAIFGGAAIIAGIVILADDEDDDLSQSPGT